MTKLAKKTFSILIVEDDRATARVAKTICESLGYAVEVVHNGMEAVQHCQRQSVGLVFLDLQMPLMGGFETAFELRQQEAEQDTARIPIVAVSGAVTPANKARCRYVQMDECLHKPYTVQMVQEMINRYMPSNTQAEEFATIMPPAQNALL